MFKSSYTLVKGLQRTTIASKIYIYLIMDNEFTIGNYIQAIENYF